MATAHGPSHAAAWTATTQTPPFVAVATGAASFALSGDGRVYAWGSNHWGQLDDGTTTDRGTPGLALDVTGATALAIGNDFGCALLATHHVMCWGAGHVGQLGDGVIDATRTHSPAVEVSGLTDAASMCAGGEHAC